MADAKAQVLAGLDVTDAAAGGARGVVDDGGMPVAPAHATQARLIEHRATMVGRRSGAAR